MPSKRTFSEEQIEKIKELRDENYSYEQIAPMMGVSKSRIKQYCQNVLGEKEVKTVQSYVPEIVPCSVPLPKFSNPACKGHNPNLWFTVLPNGAKKDQITQAKVNKDLAIKICSSCDNQLECLEYGVKAEPYGIWGGTTEGERMYIRKKLNIFCARDGGLVHGVRGLNRRHMYLLLNNPDQIEFLFTNPLLTRYLSLHK